MAAEAEPEGEPETEPEPKFEPPSEPELEAFDLPSRAARASERIFVHPAIFKALSMRLSDPDLLYKAIPRIESVARLLPSKRRSNFVQRVAEEFVEDFEPRIRPLPDIEFYTDDQVPVGDTVSPDETDQRVPNAENADITAAGQQLVKVDLVVRGGSYIAGAIALLSLIATFLSKVIIIQPFVALFILIASVGFYCMTLVPHEPD